MRTATRAVAAPTLANGRDGSMQIAVSGWLCADMFDLPRAVIRLGATWLPPEKGMVDARRAGYGVAVDDELIRRAHRQGLIQGRRDRYLHYRRMHKRSR